MRLLAAVLFAIFAVAVLTVQAVWLAARFVYDVAVGRPA